MKRLLGLAIFAGVIGACGSDETAGQDYTDENAVAAMGAEDPSNPLNHARYTDAEAVAAMGAKDPTNAFNHDRYSDADAVAAMGVEDNANPLNHTRYTDAECLAVADAEIATHAAVTDAHHSRYTDTEAATAMGAKDLTNPLNHDRYTDVECLAVANTQIAAHAAITDAHHARYTNAEAVASMGVEGDANPLNHTKYTDADAQSVLETLIDSCPIGMVDGGTFCIEIDERAPAADVTAAGQACSASDLRLCRFDEWYKACDDLLGLNNMTDNFEATANIHYDGANMVSTGSGNSGCGVFDAQSGPFAYRCCKSKVPPVTTPEPWTPLAFETGWSNLQPDPFGINFTSYYYKDAHGVVHLRGAARNPSASAGSTIFILPLDYRPPAQMLVDAGTQRIRIRASGSVQTTENITAVYFDGISWATHNY